MEKRNNNFPIELEQQNQNSQNNQNQNDFSRRSNGPYINSAESPLMGMSPGYDNALNVEMHYQEILNTLNRIADNREINMTNAALILVVALFLVYMAIDFGLSEGFSLRVPRDLFMMIVCLFILVVVLHRNDTCNLKKK